MSGILIVLREDDYEAECNEFCTDTQGVHVDPAYFL